MKSAVEQVIQDDEDFLVEIIDWNGHSAVKKSARQTTRPERLKRLKNEAYGLRFFKDLSQKNPQLNLYIPDLYKATNNYIINEYIAAPPLGDNQENLDRLAKLLAGIDRIKPYGRARITPHFDYHNVRQRFPIWIERPLAKGLITQAQIDEANKILDALEPYIQPRIAHGDLSPYAHSFRLSDGKIAFVDLEVFTPQGARYYDVARCYTRLWSGADSTEAPKKFLKCFLTYAEPVDNQKQQILAIILQRTIGMQRDAVVDADKGNDYRNRAAELLNLVLQAKLELLHS